MLKRGYKVRYDYKKEPQCQENKSIKSALVFLETCLTAIFFKQFMTKEINRK